MFDRLKRALPGAGSLTSGLTGRREGFVVFPEHDDAMKAAIAAVLSPQPLETDLH